MEPIDKLREYARKLADHPKWTWHPGMAPMGSSGDSEWVYSGPGDSGHNYYACGEETAPQEFFGEIPDPNHPATKGWLTEMLREATLSADIRYYRFSNRPPDRMWDLEVLDETFSGATDGEALAKALLHAWGQP